MSPIVRARFPATMEKLPEILLWVRNQLIQTEIDSRSSHKIELAAEEAIVNAIHHAYSGKQGEIELIFKVLSESVELTILDHGPPFNPLLDALAPDISSSVESRKEGGLGIFLLRKCVDHLHYQREKETNALTLIKHFSRKK